MPCPNCTRLERAIFQLIAPGDTLQTLQPAIKGKRKATAASKRYGRAFKKVAKDFKLKNGSWKKNGFRSAVRAAHKLAKSNRKL